MIDIFDRYARTCYAAYGDRVKYWITINEQNNLIMHAIRFGTLKKEEASYKNRYEMNHIMCLAQAKAAKSCREMIPNAKVGLALSYRTAYPASCKPEDVLAAENYRAMRNWLYLDLAYRGEYNPIAWAYLEAHDATPTILEGDMDILKSAKPNFIGINYYRSTTWTACHENEKFVEGTINLKGRKGESIYQADPGWFKETRNPYLDVTDWDWAVDPIGFRLALREVYDRYRLPIMITENGFGAYDSLVNGKVEDDYRIEYLRKHIHACLQAVNDGVDLIGYCVWSAIDLVSVNNGISKRYGLIYVNRDEHDLKDLKRIPKKSFYWYRNVIQSNGSNL